MKKSANKAVSDTRGRIVLAAFDEFYKNGFQGSSINHIIEKAGTTKGGLFHHFADKKVLGYAVLEEIIQPEIRRRWLEPLAGSVDPIADIKRVCQQLVKEDVKSGLVPQGCPLNNLAQEMSSLDEGFHKRIERVYTEWRGCLEAAFAQGIKTGKVKKGVSPQNVAIFIVAVQMGTAGSAKNSQSADLMTRAVEAMSAYLDTLVP